MSDATHFTEIDPLPGGTVREAGRLVRRIAELEAEVERWQSLASQITTDWIPANQALSARAEAAEAESKRIVTALQDPALVHASMVKGMIAVISWRQHCHLTGDVFNGEDAQLAEIVRLREELTAAESKLRAVAELPGKWRDKETEIKLAFGEHKSYRDGNDCADELEALLKKEGA